MYTDPKRSASLCLFHEGQVFVYSVPVDDVPEGFNEFCSVILVVNIVGVFPNIQSHNYLKIGENVDVVFFNLHNQCPSDAWVNC